MQIKFKFKNINSNSTGKFPVTAISVNRIELYDDVVQHEITLDFEPQEQNHLKIHFVNKQPEDTEVDSQGNIVGDVNFELESISVDGEQFAEMLWEGCYYFNDQTIPGCLFFGPAGHYSLDFILPVLKWQLKTNHEKHNNDPEWETDYNYYQRACQILESIK